MIPRTLARRLRHAAARLPVVAVTGPRQSGKTTLARHTFPSYDYLSLEDPDTREYAERDPRAFLADHPAHAILDEVQRTPSLLSYLQSHVDRSGRHGLYILTGSQNLLLLQSLSQTLAGRAAYLTLLPLSLEERAEAPHAPLDLDACLFRGGYPRLLDRRLAPGDWFPGYIQAYIEREVRLLKNITDLSAFQRFVRLCAGRVGQLVNLSSLANDAGITHNTAAAWLSVLEATFVIVLLRPHHANFNKRLVKAPKLYFVDSGLACALLGIRAADQLATHPLRGGLFESLVVTETLKYRVHRGLDPGCWFWRDKLGHEIDCVVESAQGLSLLEAKAGTTPADDFFRNLRYWRSISGGVKARAAVVYGGETLQRRSDGDLVPWNALASFLATTRRAAAGR